MAIQPVTHGMFERLIIHQKVDGCWVELNGNAQGSWQPQSQAITAMGIPAKSSGYVQASLGEGGLKKRHPPRSEACGKVDEGGT